MRLPWVRRRTLHREIANLGHAYRWQIDAAEKKARVWERRLDGLVRAHADRRLHEVAIVTRIDRSLLARLNDRELAEEIARRLTFDLFGAGRDYRPDLRTPERLPLT